jgi:hypothetical protein
MASVAFFVDLFISIFMGIVVFAYWCGYISKENTRNILNFVCIYLYIKLILNILTGKKLNTYI